MICRKVTLMLPDATYPSARAQKPRFCARKARKRGLRRQKAHKNADFVLGKSENEGSEGQKSTKTPILCSGGLFCALSAGQQPVGNRKHPAGNQKKTAGNQKKTSGKQNTLPTTRKRPSATKTPRLATRNQPPSIKKVCRSPEMECRQTFMQIQ